MKKKQPSLASTSLESSPISSETSDSSEIVKCQVCDHPSHGNHFGANTCRACAAFFRRIMLTSHEQLNCRLLNDKCVPNSSGKWFCKKCRLNRCLSLNMIPDNIQHDRDLFSTSEKFIENKRRKLLDEPHSLKSDVSQKKPKLILCVTRSDRTIESSWIDMTPLVQKAKQKLIEVPINDEKFVKMNSLEKLTYGLKQVQKQQKEKITEAKKIGQLETCCIWENEVCKTARWLMYCDEFRILNCDQRLEILKCIWHIWNRIERVSTTSRMRKKKLCGENQFVVSHEQYVDYDNVELEMTWMTNYSKEQLKYYLHPISNWFNEYLVPLFTELDPTDTELTYVLCHTCFHYTGKKLGADIREATDRLQEVIANNLHEYYVSKGNLSRYSHRLKKLLDISYYYQKSSYDRLERFEVGAVFDVFKIDFSHPEMFQFSF